LPIRRFLFGKIKNIDDLQNGEGVNHQKDDKPFSLRVSYRSPQSHALPWKHPSGKKRENPWICKILLHASELEFFAIAGEIKARFRFIEPTVHGEKNPLHVFLGVFIPAPVGAIPEDFQALDDLIGPCLSQAAETVPLCFAPP